jgi:agarase
MKSIDCKRWLLFAATLFFPVPDSIAEDDWDEIEIPVKLDHGETWQHLDISDSFSYEKTPLGKPAGFSKRWNESFINNWTGPGLTQWTVGHAYTINGHLGIAASRIPREKNAASNTVQAEKVRTGCISSKQTFMYPLYVEARVKISNQVLASNVWMLSTDSTQEIDVVEAYGSDRPDQTHFAERIHLSHHVFIRKPFQDYQPTDAGSWFSKGVAWREGFHRVGVYWRDPWHLEYYVDGKLARITSGRSMIDPQGFTEGTGLSKPMHIIVNMEDQDWRSDAGITPTDDELGDVKKSIMWVDWIRICKPTSRSSQ